MTEIRILEGGLTWGNLEDVEQATRAYEGDFHTFGGEVFHLKSRRASRWNIVRDIASGRPGSGVQVSVLGPGRGVAAAERHPEFYGIFDARQAWEKARRTLEDIGAAPRRARSGARSDARTGANR